MKGHSRVYENKNKGVVNEFMAIIMLGSEAEIRIYTILVKMYINTHVSYELCNIFNNIF